MAAYAAVASLMNSIEQMSNHPRLFNSFNHKQIQTLLEKARFLLAFIEGINYVAGDKEVEDLERRIARSAYAAEDVIESHIVHQIHAYKDADESHVDVDHILDEEASSIFLLNVEKKVRDMDVIIEKANELMAKDASTEEQRPTHSTPLVESGDTAMVGLDAELNDLLLELTGHQSSRHTISIVGMGGVGKTTLAKSVYAHSFIVEHFDIRAWATISQQYNEVEIFSQLLSSLGQSTKGTAGELEVRLHKTLFGRRYLVVLDDIWNVEAWDRVRHYFPSDGNSSRVILTTRLSNLASVCGSSCIKIDLLDEDKSWELFCQKTLFSYKDVHFQLERVGKEIVRLCKGLALSIVVIGGLLLKSPRTVGFWEGVAKNIKSFDAKSNEKQESLDVLSLSYNHLPPHLKPCFLYMGVFEEDSVTRVSTLSRLWVAEGFIRTDGARVLEEIAEGYLNDLVDRNLILVRSRRYNGKIGSCGIHDLLRDLCIKVAGQQDFFQYAKVGTEDGGKIGSCGIHDLLRHMCINVAELQDFFQARDGRRIVCNPDQYQSSIEFPLTRSLLMSPSDTSFVGVDKCKLLRVFSNARGDSGCPEISFGNVNLRYLTYTYDSRHLLNSYYVEWKLSSSISLIWNLQTLVISPNGRTELIFAPSEIWKMRQLRHFEGPKILLPSEGRDGSFILENLQTLTTTTNLELSEEVCKMIPEIKKFGLVYRPSFPGYDDSIIECLCNIGRLHKLESLKMETSMYYPYLPSLPKLAFPSSLLKLSLIGFELGSWKDLRVVGLLPQLQVLNLENLDIKEWENRWSPAKEEFLSLKLLKIEECNLCFSEIVDWPHFPVLKKLILYRMPYLSEIPSAIGEIPTLEFISVGECSVSAAISAVRIKEEHLETQEEDDDALRIEVWFHQTSDMQKFKEGVETEQLTLDHIHLK